MIIGEIGVNHNGNLKYAKKLTAELLKTKVDAISIQIRTDQHYLRKDKKHLKIKDIYYENFYKIVKKKKKIGLALEDLKTFQRFKHLKFDFIKIISSPMAQNMNIVNYILKNSKSNIYISSGLMNKGKIKKYLNLFKKNKRVKIGYTKLSYEEEHMNLEQLKNLSLIFKNKLAYCHHLKDEITILIVNAISNIDTFFYVKGNNTNVKHPDEHHAIRLNNVNKIVSDINKVKKIMGNKTNFFFGNNIKDQKI